MLVHEAAKALGITPRTLRFYEEKGLISPLKEDDNGYRNYSEEDLYRLRWIVSFRELRMTVAQISEVIPLLHQPHCFIRKVNESRAQLYKDLADAVEALRAFDETIASWQQEGLPQLTQAEQAAKRIKQNRCLRSAWSDEWNYDEMALQYGHKAPIVALYGIIEARQYENALRRTAEWVDPAPDEHGLELGSGNGNLTMLLCASGARMTVVEQSSEMLSLLRERLPYVDARQGNLLALPISEQNRDFIACSFALQHIARSGQLLALGEMDRTLKPKGKIVITGIMEEQRHTKRSSESNEGLTPSLIPELLEWFHQKRYSVVTEKLADSLFILCAVKPSF